MSKWKMLSGVCAMIISASAMAADKSAVPAALNFKMKSIEGQEVDLAEKYAGKVVLVVNVASACGLTPQYEQLEKLHQQYGKEGLAVLGFPCNQFGAQEPGTEAEISKFCKTKYAVDFDMFSKVEVKGDGACGLYKHLTSLDAKPKGSGVVSWNFEKFLIDRKGNVVARFAPKTAPNDPEVLKAISTELEKK